MTRAPDAAGISKGAARKRSPEIAALPSWLACCIPPWLRGPQDRGEAAEAPTAIPAAGWLDVAIRTVRSTVHDDVSTIAAGVTFYAMLAFIPALSAAAAAYELFARPVTALHQATALQGVAPNEAVTLIAAELERLGERPTGQLTWILGVGVVAMVGSLNAAMMALLRGLNVAYGEEERRSFLHRHLVAAAFAGGLVLLLPLTFGSLLVGRGVAGATSLSPMVVGALRFSFLALVAGTSLALLYRYAPCRQLARWRWVTPGGLLAALLWLACSSALTVYLTQFAQYQRTYGLLGAFMAVMVWLWAAVAVTMLGAELNAELEAQTERETAES